jgi:hypothetical protein
MYWTSQILQILFQDFPQCPIYLFIFYVYSIFNQGFYYAMFYLTFNLGLFNISKFY